MLKHPGGVSCRFKASWRKKMTPHLHLAHLAYTQTKSNDHEWSLSEAHNSRCGIGESDWINLNQFKRILEVLQRSSEIFRCSELLVSLDCLWWVAEMSEQSVKPAGMLRVYFHDHTQLEAVCRSLSHQPHSWHQLTKSMIPELRVGWAPRRY